MLPKKIQQSTYYHGPMSDEVIEQILRAKRGVYQHSSIYIIHSEFSEESLYLTLLKDNSFQRFPLTLKGLDGAVSLMYYPNNVEKVLNFKNIDIIAMQAAYGVLTELLGSGAVGIKRVPDYIKSHSYYHDISRTDAETILQNEPMKFIIRKSSDPAAIAVSFTQARKNKRVIVHGKYTISSETQVNFKNQTIDLADLPKVVAKSYGLQSLRSIHTRKTSILEKAIVDKVESVKNNTIFDYCYGANKL